MTKSDLRVQLSTLRQSLSDGDRSMASYRVREKLCALDEFQQAKTIACYYAFGSELDPRPILQSALAASKVVTLPTVVPDKTLVFYQYTTHSELIQNIFGIQEVNPKHSVQIPLSQHDIILLPLLGFDPDCNRIGMGAGFYDKTLAQLGEKRPLLIALGYDIQCVNSISIDSWDIKMDKIITEKTIYGTK